MAVLSGDLAGRVSVRARDVRLGRTLLTVLAGLLWLVGWSVRAVVTGIVVALRWVVAAVLVGWTDGWTAGRGGAAR